MPNREGLKWNNWIWQKNTFKKKQKVYKQPNKVSDKKKERLETMREADIFFEIANKRDRVSEISGHSIPEACSFCFANILSKWKYPEYRYFKNNIAFVKDQEEHSFLDELVNWYENICETMIKDWVPSTEIIKYLKEQKKSTKKAQKKSWKLKKNLYCEIDEW